MHVYNIKKYFMIMHQAASQFQEVNIFVIIV